MKLPTSFPAHAPLAVQTQPAVIPHPFATYDTHWFLPTQMSSKVDLNKLDKTLIFRWNVPDMKGIGSPNIRAAYQILHTSIPEHTPWGGLDGLLSNGIVDTSLATGGHGGEFKLTKAVWQQAKWELAENVLAPEPGYWAGARVYVRMMPVSGLLALAKPTSCVELTFGLIVKIGGQ